MAKKKKRNLGWKILLYTSIAAALFMIGLTAYEYYLERRAKFVRYTAFGIDIPTAYNIHGIDVSKYQNIIDWESVKEMQVEDVKVSFAFIKATEGISNTDAYFKRNWKLARDAGIARGAYHFFLATKSGKMQAENFIKKVDLEPGDLPPVLDVEQTYGVAPAKMRERIIEWLQTVEAYYKVKPILYTNVDFYKFYLKDEFDGYPLWVAHYLQKERPRIHRDWIFWQHSESGHVNGIRAYVDFNVFNGDSVAFSNLLIK
ncbi:MAG TPA: glycoside hydrolase family 25 protein [Chitinophagaceae bacterium]|nr:glycoside hydrolase family 25 protein [Chitinophagaceae bacterium]